MIRKIALAAFAVAAIAAPAFASEDRDDARIQLNTVEQTLQARGWNVSNVEDWGTKYRVTVIGDNGQASTVLLDRANLQPASAVLTQTDTGRAPAAAPANDGKAWLEVPQALVTSEDD